MVSGAQNARAFDSLAAKRAVQPEFYSARNTRSRIVRVSEVASVFADNTVSGVLLADVATSITGPAIVGGRVEVALGLAYHAIEVATQRVRRAREAIVFFVQAPPFDALSARLRFLVENQAAIQ